MEPDQALEPYYTLPSYANDFPPLADYFGVADEADGKRDGKWRGWELTTDNEKTLGKVRYTGSDPLISSASSKK